MTISSGPVGVDWESRSAEDVLPGHPDRLCDAIAEAIVTKALRREPRAHASIEAATFRDTVLVTGQLRLGDPGGGSGLMRRPDGFWPDDFAPLVHDQMAAAGYVDGWAHRPEVTVDVSAGAMGPDDRAAKSYSIDQTISVGHADPDGPDLLPLEVAVARRVKDAVATVRARHADVLGPDGKVLVEVAVPTERGALGVRRRPRLERINVAIQHVESVGYPELYRWIVPELERVIDELGSVLDASDVLDGESLRINAAGAFVRGGPDGDGGLSGKKLVVDHYGPRIPIGGGAICGKDAHQPDRIGALRARQVAVRLARATGQATTVTMGFLPGLAGPDRFSARLADGTVLDADRIAGAISVPDLTLAGSATDLRLADVDWPAVMRRGYFGTGQTWEE